MYRHSVIVVILLECVFGSCAGGSVRLHPLTTTTTTNPTSDQTTVQPGQRHELQWGTESELPPLDVRSIKGKTPGIVSSAGRLVRDRRRSRFLCHGTLATKIDNCTQTFERLYAEHKLTTANTEKTHLETQHLCRQHDESLYCLHVELMACPPRPDHLGHIAEEIGYLRDYMEDLCRSVRQTQYQASSTVPIYSSPPLESYILHKKFNQQKHKGPTVVQKTVTDKFQPTTDRTANSFGHVSHSNLSSKMLLNGNIHNEDKDSEFNKKIHHKISNIKVYEENATEADSIRTSQNSVDNSSSATMPIVEPQILSKRNNPRTHNSSPSQVPNFRCLCLQLICGFTLTVVTFHRH